MTSNLSPAAAAAQNAARHPDGKFGTQPRDEVDIEAVNLRSQRNPACLKCGAPTSFAYEGDSNDGGWDCGSCGAEFSDDMAADLARMRSLGQPIAAPGTGAPTEWVGGHELRPGDALVIDGEERTVHEAYSIVQREPRPQARWVVAFESFDRDENGAPEFVSEVTFGVDETFARLADTRPAAHRLDYAQPDGETLQTAAPLDRLSLNTGNRPAWDIVRSAEEGRYDTEPPYQRGDVWELGQRQKLIESFVRGIPVPAITVNDRTVGNGFRDAQGRTPLDTGKGMYALVDGKQRVETCRQWFASEFGVPASWFDPSHVETTFETPDGPYVTYEGLTQGARNRWQMTMAAIPVNTAQVPSVEEEARLYLLLNGGGTPQTEADMERAREAAEGTYY